MEFLYNNFISDLFTNAINGIYGWGLIYPVAIILLTIMIRAAMLPLDTKQRANAKKMSALGPELQSIQKRYANDPQKMQRKQQELYKKMGAHPMMGCLPALIQLPIWFAFFGAMRVLQTEQTMSLMLNATQFGPDAVSLPSFLWVHNFWQPDSGFSPVLPAANDFLSFIQSNAMNIPPQVMSMLQQQNLVSFAGDTLTMNESVYTTLTNDIVANAGLSGFANGWFILPATAGLSLFFQQKFGASEMAATGTGGAQGQPGGKFMLWFFPLFSVYICITSPASFALYWTVSSAYAFGQARLVDTIQKKRGKGKKEVVVSNS
jgi:YidC/Oxa1 family membrane protein insertase